MIRRLLIACVLPLLATTGLAQTPKLPADIAGLPNEIKTLKCSTIDMATVKPLEHCRALLLMNHTLDELSANAAAEADLMSEYIETNKLGQQFASTPPPPTPRALTYPDAEKIAVALLRGPMSSSYYATELGDVPPASLASYEQMYARTCARRWSEFEESRHLVRCMASFLGNTNKLQDYDAWAIAESARREAEAQQRSAAASAKAQQNAAQQKVDAQLREQQLELMQMKAALAAAHSQQQEGAPAQPAANNQTVTPGGQAAQAVNGGYVVDGSSYGYGGYGGYGYYYASTPAEGAAAGAYAANQYHAANSTWNHTSGYNSEARERTEGRMSGFHGVHGRR